ncbi:hypothetical protein [Thalassotalea fusca]
MQYRTILQHKKHQQSANSPTAILSMNQFFISFLAYFSFFIYGYSVEPFNHFIVWPRLIAALVVTLVIIEIWRDKRCKLSYAMLLTTLLIIVLGGAGALMTESVRDDSKAISTAMILIISALIAQGYMHQFLLIIRSGQTGAINLKMSQFIFAMDLSTIAFAVSMGLSLGWPLLVLAITSAITKLVMMYLFYWVKHSEHAAMTRKSKQLQENMN